MFAIKAAVDSIMTFSVCISKRTPNTLIDDGVAFTSICCCYQDYDWTIQSGFALQRDKHPQLEDLDRLHVIGRVEAHLAVVKATFTPALFVLLLQLRQLVPFISERRQTCSSYSAFTLTPLPMSSSKGFVPPLVSLPEFGAVWSSSDHSVEAVYAWFFS
ncbi:hypothetical protein INR49_014114 [Caranx melampygus]|nr:hypothetical protein INR49_014114 [Caranx melampygus]